MSAKELDRTEVFLQLQQKIVSQQEAAELLGITTRHVRRLFQEYKKIGTRALISKRRGKPSNHQLPPAVKELTIALIQQKYADFGPTFAHEKIEKVHSVKISISSVRSLMITKGLWTAKKIKKRRIYQLRERRESEGELVQIDGSPHEWLEGRGPKCSLLLTVDDATSKIKAGLFAHSETIWSYFRLIQMYLENHGRPKAFYSDKHAVFRVNKSEALGGEGITQFGRAMQELDIEMIFANSPQAKGRIERSNRTLQDRLVKELRLNKISTIEEANAFLSTFIEDYNRRFAVVAKTPHNAHRPLLREHNSDLTFTIQGFRYLSKNLIFQYKNVLYQIVTERETYALRKAKVTIREQEDGSLQVLYKGKMLDFVVYNLQQKQGEVVDSKNLNEVIDNLQSSWREKVGNKPAYNHPWKRGSRKFLFGRTAL